MFNHMVAGSKTIVNRLGRTLREKDIEDKGTKRCKTLNWLFEKFVSPEKRAVPDRIVTAHNETTTIIFFIEFKKPHALASILQRKDHENRRKRGCMVFVVDSYEELEEVIYIIENCLDQGITFVPSWSLPSRLLV